MSLAQSIRTLFQRLGFLPAHHGIAAHAEGAAYRRGDDIGGTYVVQGILGVGGFGVVYLVRGRESGAMHALKTLRDEYLRDSGTRELFRREARVWVGLDRHPNIVRADFITELSGRLYIGMEYIEPGDDGLSSLAGHLTAHPPDLAQAIRWCIQFCHGMEYARSRGIRCHRDVKPENIMITREKTVKIADFGFAGVIEHVRAGTALPTRRRSVQRSGFGTPTYMPPEQFQNASRCDERSDIYSLGIVMYQLVSRGRLPFVLKGHRSGDYWNDMHRLHADAPVPRLSSPLSTIIERCLQKEPNKRYQSFADLRADLDALLKRETGGVEKAGAARGLAAWELYNKAYSLSNLGHLEEALIWYDKALEVDPENADAWINKGACQHKLGRLEDSVRSFSRALAVDKHNAAASRNLGSSLFALGRLEDALDAFKKGASLEPSNESVWLNIGLVEDRLGRTGDAVASFHAYLAKYPHGARIDYARKRIEELSRE
ncbi:MAG: protein kinase [Bacteroidetes bacterium]|nr:protein kinase [Bacteroidota bacterium]